MNNLESFYILSLSVQVIHSIEELSTGFHKRWYLFKMPFLIFLLFEILFTSFWIVILLVPSLPNRTMLQTTFLLLMFANGVQHLVWWGNVKKYVPGLLTTPIHIIIAFIYFLGLN